MAKHEVKNVVVIGLGYVGLPLAILAKKQGFSVQGLDVDKTKNDLINDLKAPFFDPTLDAALKANPIKASSNSEILADADIVVICVPTPVDEDRKPDFIPLIKACTSVAAHIGKRQLIIIESTINPGICDEVIIPILERESGLRVGEDFMLAHCPERINPGDETWNVTNIPRVIGGYDTNSLEQAMSFYDTLLDAELYPMGSIKEAEAVKLVENSFRDINIAFVNELAVSFSKMGIDVNAVINGAASKPFAFMPHYPGIGVGGHCIPVDPYYLIEYAKGFGMDHKLLKQARETNENMPAFGVSLLQDGMFLNGNRLAGSTIGVLGLSYKADVGDLRESPSLKVIELLQKDGVHVIAHDPYISTPLLEGVQLFQELDMLLQKADAIILCTAHQEYLGINPTILQDTPVKVVIDGRNSLNKKSFDTSEIIYRGIGI